MIEDELFSQSINELREGVSQAFRAHRDKEEEFYQLLQLWLLKAPLLCDESEEVIGQIFESIKQKIRSEPKIEDVVEVIGKISREHFYRERRKRQVKTIEENWLESMQKAQAEGGPTRSLPSECLKKLGSTSRLLIALYSKRVKKTEIAQMLMVSSARVTQYFKEAEKEIKKKCKDL